MSFKMELKRVDTNLHAQIPIEAFIDYSFFLGLKHPCFGLRTWALILFQTSMFCTKNMGSDLVSNIHVLD